MINYSLAIESILQTKKRFLSLGNNKEFNHKIYIDKTNNELTNEDRINTNSYKILHYDAIESLYKKDRFNNMMLPNEIKNLMNSNYGEHVANAIQPNDSELILKSLSYIDIDINDFCFELACKTLLAQIIHFYFKSSFNFDAYENPDSLTKYEFIEVIGDCPNMCNHHISPLTVPYNLFLLKNIKSAINESYSVDNVKNENILKIFMNFLIEYKNIFDEKIYSLLPLICIDYYDGYDLIENKFRNFEINKLNIN